MDGLTGRTAIGMTLIFDDDKRLFNRCYLLLPDDFGTLMQRPAAFRTRFKGHVYEPVNLLRRERCAFVFLMTFLSADLSLGAAVFLRRRGCWFYDIRRRGF
jgi:hypothetical protein